MSTIVRRFMDRFFPNKEYRVVIFGVGGGGKTTLLYQLHLGEVVKTIPTMGFNVETVQAPTISGRPLKFTGWDLGMGCASVFTMARLWASYVDTGHALVWVVDASDPRLLDESVQAIKQMLKEVDSLSSGRPDYEERKRRFPILLLANKRDKPKVMPIDDIRKAFSQALVGRTANIFSTSFTQPLDQGGLQDAFGWLQIALEMAGSGPGAAVLPTLDEQHPAKDVTGKLDSWLARTETDTDPNSFLAQFHSFNLPAWDHYTHIRIAFTILATYGRKEGKDMIFNGIEKYIQQSATTRGRSFHLTMTYFWIQIVHLGMQSVALSKMSGKPLEAALQTPSGDPSLESFARFLLLSPYVSDANLWTDYYSREVMMGTEAKVALVLPDKKPLPNLVVRDAIST